MRIARAGPSNPCIPNGLTSFPWVSGPREDSPPPTTIVNLWTKGFLKKKLWTKGKNPHEVTLSFRALYSEAITASVRVSDRFPVSSSVIYGRITSGWCRRASPPGL